MKEIKDIIKWAKSQSKSLERAALKTSALNISNIYYSRKEWIDFELIPRLEKALKASAKK